MWGDHGSLTVTTPNTAAPRLIHTLKDRGFECKLLPLKGYFHSQRNLHLGNQALQFVKSSAHFQFPQLNQFADVWSDAPPGRRPKKTAHESILKSILMETADWPSALKLVKDGLGSGSPLSITTFGDAKSFPQVLLRSAASKGAHVEGSSLSEYFGGTDTKSESGTHNPHSHHRGDIAIVGAACRFPKASSPEQLWNLLCSGISTCTDIRDRRFAAHLSQERQQEKFWANLCNDVASFDNKHFNISAREAMYMDPQQRVILEVAYEALLSAGYLSTAKRESEVGCYLGVGAVEYGDNIGSNDHSAFSAPGSLRAFISGRISHYFGWRGPSICIDTACSSVRHTLYHSLFWH